MSLSEYHRWTNWIGTDESGKGDYFGSLVVAGVFVDEEALTDHVHTVASRISRKSPLTLSLIHI